jgi:hypothetical protein
MNTIKQTFAGLLLITALVLFGSLLGFGQDRPTPTPPLFPDCADAPHGKCVGTCPTLWVAGVPNPMPVQPYTDHAHPDPCHKIQGNCTCAYSYEAMADCHKPAGGGPCGGNCPRLYRTPQDAQNGVNPVDFAHHNCQTDNIRPCTCYYY